MDERHDPQTNAPDEGELLAAYLAAETDDLTSARIERRILEDPQVAGRLDALARTRTRMQRLDAVQPPPGFRERLDARLHAERATHVPERAPSEHAAAATTEAPRRARWFARQRFVPMATAAALVLVTVLGGAALLNITAGRGAEESAVSGEAAQEGAATADGPLAAEPFAAPDRAEGGAEDGDQESGADDSALTPQQDAAPTLPARSLPQVAVDADIAARLRDEARSTDEPAIREADLRRRSDLPPQPLCLDDVDAAAVDLVERDGRIVLAALVTDTAGPEVVLFDPDDCSRLRVFAP